MNIHPINQNTSFGTCIRCYKPSQIKRIEPFGQDIIRTSTNLFREDLDWFRLVQYITRHFLFKDKINIYSMASSDGSEAYSLGITLMQKISDAVGLRKYLPIIASDIDPEMIKTAKTGRINIADFELDFYDNAKLKMRNFFTKESKAMKISDDYWDRNITHSYKPIKELKDSVIFRVGDILSELNNIKDSGNSVILCRNVFPYLNESYRNDVIKSASENLKEGSLFVTGDYDEKVKISEKLLDCGFVNPIADLLNIFLKLG